MYFALGFAEIQLAEDFCNGIPLGYTVGGIPQYTDPMTDSAVFALAAAQADAASRSPPARTRRRPSQERAARSPRHAPRSTWARPRRRRDGGLGPDEFPVRRELLAAHQRQRLVDHDDEQQALLGRRQRRRDGDDHQRAAVRLGARSARSDDATRQRLRQHDAVLPAGDLEPRRPGRDRARVDARLIEAEAKLRAGDIAGMMTILNALRATPPTHGIFKLRHARRARDAGQPVCRDVAVLPRKGVLDVRPRPAIGRSSPPGSPVRAGDEPGVRSRIVLQERSIWNAHAVPGAGQRAEQPEFPRVSGYEPIEGGPVDRWTGGPDGGPVRRAVGVYRRPPVSASATAFSALFPRPLPSFRRRPIHGSRRRPSLSSHSHSPRPSRSFPRS